MDNTTPPVRAFYVNTAKYAKAMSTDAMKVTVSAQFSGWLVAFQPTIDHEDRPTVDAWHSLEWVAWFTRDLERGDSFEGAEPSFDAYPHSAPPWLNEPGHMFTLCVASSEERRPLAGFVADFIKTWNEVHESPQLTAP